MLIRVRDVTGADAYVHPESVQLIIFPSALNDPKGVCSIFFNTMNIQITRKEGFRLLDICNGKINGATTIES